MNEKKQDQSNFWKWHSEERKRLEMTRAGYCRANNLIENRMYHWERKFNGKLRRKKSDSSFIPIVLEKKSSSGVPIRIRMVSGIEILLENLPQVNWLMELERSQGSR